MVVGATDGSEDSGRDASNVVLGIFLVTLAQVFSVLNKVVLEKLFQSTASMENMSLVEAVGWNGLFGLTLNVFMLLCMYLVPVVGRDTCGIDHKQQCIDNTITAVRQLATSPEISTAFALRG